MKNLIQNIKQKFLFLQDKLSEPDKKKHENWGLTFLAFFLCFFNIYPALFLAIMVGLGKEVVWDHLLGKGTPDVYDAIATIYKPCLIVAAWGIAMSLFYMIN